MFQIANSGCKKKTQPFLHQVWDLRWPCLKNSNGQQDGRIRSVTGNVGECQVSKSAYCASVLQCLTGYAFFIFPTPIRDPVVHQPTSSNSGPDGMCLDKIRTYMHLSLARQERDVLSYFVTLLGLINVFLAKGVLPRTTYHMGRKAHLHI